MKLNVLSNIKNVPQILVCISLFFLPISTSLSSLSLAGAILYLIQGHTKADWQTIRQSSFFWLTLCLLALMLFAMMYSSAPIHDSLRAFKKYAHRLALFLLVIPMFSDKKWRDYYLNSVILTAVVISFFDTLDVLGLISLKSLFAKEKNILLSAIPWSIYCAYALFFLLYQLIQKRNKRLLQGLLACYMFAYLFFINYQRTGMVLALFFVGFCLFLLFKQNKYYKTILLISVTALVTVFFSTHVRQRIDEGFSDIKAYQAGEVRTSLGLRVAFTLNSLAMIKEKPIIGHGTGSFATEYKKIGGPTILSTDDSLGDPHNSFLHLAVQLGLFGLLLFCAWLFSLLSYAYHLPKEEKQLAIGIIFAFILTNLSVSAFYRSRIALLFLLTLAMLFSASLRKQNE